MSESKPGESSPEKSSSNIIVPQCIYPGSNALSMPIKDALSSVAANKAKCTSFLLATLPIHSLGGENHHQGLARTHRLSDGSVYFFLTHSFIEGPNTGQLMQFKYGGPLDDAHVIDTHPLTVASMEEMLSVEDGHPSDLVFLPDVNQADAGYLFVTEEYNSHQVVVYAWAPGSPLTKVGSIFQGFPNHGPAYIFLDLVGDTYYLGIASTKGIGRLFTASCFKLFPGCRQGGIDLNAFTPAFPESLFIFPAVDLDTENHNPSQVKLIRDSLGDWYLLGFRSDDEHGNDYVDVYQVRFSPFAISGPLLPATHIFFRKGDTGFANTGTHYVEPSGRLLISSSYRWSERIDYSNTYRSRVDECPSES